MYCELEASARMVQDGFTEQRTQIKMILFCFLFKACWGNHVSFHNHPLIGLVEGLCNDFKVFLIFMLFTFPGLVNKDYVMLEYKQQTI